MYRAAAQGKGAEKQRAAQALRGVSSPVWLQVCGLILCFREMPKNNLRIIYHKKKAFFFFSDNNQRFENNNNNAILELAPYVVPVLLTCFEGLTLSLSI